MWIFLQTVSKKTHVWLLADVRTWAPWNKGETGEVLGCNSNKAVGKIWFWWGYVVPPSVGSIAFESWIAALGGDNSTFPIPVV